MDKMVHPQEQLPINDEITSPFNGAQLEFSESELFPETVQNSEVSSNNNNNNNNCCYEDQSSYPTSNLSITIDEMNKYNTTFDHDGIHPPTATADPTTGNIFFDDQLENDISASIDFTPSPSFSVPHPQFFNNNINNNNQEVAPTFGTTPFHNQISMGDDIGPLYQYNPERRPPPRPLLGPPLQMGFKEDSLIMSSISLPSYNNIRLSNNSTVLVDPMINIGSYLPSNGLSAPFSYDHNQGIFTGSTGLFLGNDISSHHHQELDFQGDNGGMFQSADSMVRVFSCSTGDLQALSSESQHLLHGSPSTTLASEISSLDDPNFKVGKLSVEERKRKIHRYLKKRNERNFSKKIKYACRKTLADSRPRVRGRFAKNDELAEIARTTGINHDDIDTDEDLSLFSNPIPDNHNKGVKEEEDLESSDIFAHISGVNSFKCNYPIQSWI